MIVGIWLLEYGDFVRCERCGEEVRYIEPCRYCERRICRKCIKSSKRPKKIGRVVICKDCWGNLKKRAQYKAL